MSAWTRSQLERKAAVRRGATVLANQTAGADGQPVDGALIAWAQARGLFVLIDRRSRWANPYLLGGAGPHDQVCDRYAEYFASRPDLHARLPELRGKVLGCWCYPKRCHGETLLAALERLDAAGGG